MPIDRKTLVRALAAHAQIVRARQPETLQQAYDDAEGYAAFIDRIIDERPISALEGADDLRGAPAK